MRPWQECSHRDSYPRPLGGNWVASTRSVRQSVEVNQLNLLVWRGAGVVERGGLEMRLQQYRFIALPPGMS